MTSLVASSQTSFLHLRIEIAIDHAHFDDRLRIRAGNAAHGAIISARRVREGAAHRVRDCAAEVVVVAIGRHLSSRDEMREEKIGRKKQT